jgi:hypothetical protein
LREGPREIDIQQGEWGKERFEGLMRGPTAAMMAGTVKQAGELLLGDEEGVLDNVFGGEVVRKAQGVHVKKFASGGNKVTFKRDIGAW